MSDSMLPNKKMVTSYPKNNDLFEKLPDDIVISILCKLSSTADCPSDFISVLILCKRLNQLGLDPLVLSKASPSSLAVKVRKWSENARNFLNKCVDAGNVEATYILGMIEFYCLQTRRSGELLIKKAALMSHALAIYSLGIIYFNGSGKSESERDLQGGVSLYEQAASLGLYDALRELAHCTEHGYGVVKNITEGRRILLQANVRELKFALNHYRPISFKPLTWHHQSEPQELDDILIDADLTTVFWYGLMSDFGCDVPPREMHPAHGFMADWFDIRDGPGHMLQRCGNSSCGRPETRIDEFRFKCVACGIYCYCSYGCSVLDWKMEHGMECYEEGLDVEGYYNDDDSDEYDDSDEDSDGDDDIDEDDTSDEDYVVDEEEDDDYSNDGDDNDDRNN